MSSLNYRDAGVNIEAGEQLVERIKPLVKKTNRPGVLGGLGGFGGLFELPVDKYRQPVLVSGTDGVGTKLKLALEWQNHAGVGIDLVAMCVNDIVVTGAEPLFFLDYYATGKLDNDVAVQVIAGIAKGCSLAGCALVGGETAEMPGMYQHGDYDLAGFAVGVVEKDQIIASERVVAGDVLLGLASSGAHSNGYSLIRKILQRSGVDAACLDLDGQTLAEAMLAPTRIYVKSLLKLIETHDIHGMAHITGGGITENLPRALPENLDAHVTIGSWESPALFSWLRQHGNIEESEMLRTFNCGLGMVVIAPAPEAKAIEACLTGMGEKVFCLGEVKTGQGKPRVIYQR